MTTYRRSIAPWVARVGSVDDLAPGAPTVVGCSGGTDSLALLALARARDLDVVAVYVDHGLRPGTAHDAHVVQQAAAEVGAAARVVAVHVDPSANVEARARDARYAALERAADETHADAILVGHTRDDQAETVLLALLRGSATTGLAGMAAVRGRIRRPLLDLRRADTAEICARLRWAPVCDPMNDELHHRRVWLRREVMPHLVRGAHRDLAEVLARQAAVLRDDDELLDALAAQYPPDDADVLAGLPRSLARRVVRRWFGPPAPGSAAVDAVLAVARGERRAVDLPGGRRVERVGGRLHLVGRDLGSVPPSAALAVPGRTCFGPVAVETWVEEAPPVAWPDGRARAVADADLVGVTATVRVARPGERFRPLGRGGSKLVRDALIDAGVPAGLRPHAPVVSAGADAAVADDSVIWVVGYRIDDRVRVTARTRRYLWMSVDPE
ncbi:MAG: tRNA lysidine(34) synthetase TilS [Acidimicrobiia bacterium]